jgi:hypothetical protein
MLDQLAARRGPWRALLEEVELRLAHARSRQEQSCDQQNTQPAHVTNIGGKRSQDYAGTLHSRRRAARPGI